MVAARHDWVESGGILQSLERCQIPLLILTFEKMGLSVNVEFSRPSLTVCGSVCVASSGGFCRNGCRSTVREWSGEVSELLLVFCCCVNFGLLLRGVN